MEDVLDELIKKKVELPNLKCSTTGNDVFKLHYEEDVSKMSDKTINMFTCEDDTALVFNSREYLMLGKKITSLVMAKWRLTVHVGCDDKNLRLS